MITTDLRPDFDLISSNSDTNKKYISDIAQRNVLTCAADLTIKKAASLMHAQKCSSIVVIQDQQPIGIWTEAEALKLNFKNPSEAEQPIQKVMNPHVNTVDVSLEMSQAALKFKIYNTRHLIVLDAQGQMFGILSQTDVVVNQDANSFLTIADLGSVNSIQTPCVTPDTSISDVVDTMRRYSCDALVVAENRQPKGIVTTRDLVGAISKDQTQDAVCTIMSTSVISAAPSLNLLAARALMVEKNIRHIAIEGDEKQACQLISFSDILANIDHYYNTLLHASLETKKSELQVSKRHLHMANTVINAASDGIMMTDENGIILTVNPAFSQLTGYSYDEAVGQSSTLTSSGKHSKAFYREMWRKISEEGCWQGEIWNRRKSGEIYPEWLTINKVHEPYTGKTLYTGVFSDVSESKKSEKLIENLAYYDPLTELPNRQLLLDRLEMAISVAKAKEEKLAVLLIDIDHFKQINDSLGHFVGDSVLKKVAERLRSSINPQRTLARIGGDEFILLFNCDNISKVSGKAQLLLDSLSAPISENGSEFYLSVSIGCALYPSDGLTQSDLMKNAETAMYRAKSQGRNRFSLYSPDMNARFKERLMIEFQLRHALKRDEFYLLYQPKVSLSSGEVLGVEALVRWSNPELGEVYPDQFIQLAENLGLIPDIGYWVLLEAAQQAVRWQTQYPQGRSLVVSVNVSAKQFIGNQLVDQVNRVLAETGLNPKHLDLEVTESSLIDDLSLACENLTQLRELGVQVSLDDFGTGYSSLSKLNQLPLDTLKIDRSFINAVPGDHESEALVSTIIFLAHKLSLRVVAEGVEDKTQMQFLMDLDCEEMQGYYFSKPVNATEINQILATGKSLQDLS